MKRGFLCAFYCAYASFCLISTWQRSTQKQIVLYLDQNLSSQCKLDIKTCVENHVHKHCSINSLVVHLQKIFPFFAHISCEQNERDELIIMAEAHNVLCTLTDTKVLLENGRICDGESFNVNLVNSLARVSVPECVLEQEYAPESLTMCAQEILPDMCSAFEVAWISDHEIHLIDKHEHNFVIACHQEQLTKEDILTQCALFKNQLKKDGVLFNKKKTWVADVRFDKQIILFAGGTGHGANKS